MFVKSLHKRYRISLMTWYEEQIKLNTNDEPGGKAMCSVQPVEDSRGVCGKTAFTLRVCRHPLGGVAGKVPDWPWAQSPFSQQWYALGQLACVLSFPQIPALLLPGHCWSVNGWWSARQEFDVWLRSPDHCHLRRKRKRRRNRRREEEEEKVNSVWKDFRKPRSAVICYGVQNKTRLH